MSGSYRTNGQSAHSAPSNRNCVSFTFKPDMNVFSELLELMLGTNSQVIMKLDPSQSGPAVELISLGPLGTDNKLAGVYTWHRVPSFKNLEWSEVRIVNEDGDVTWIEISDAGRLVKIINSIVGLSASITDDVSCDINVRITETEMVLYNDTPCSFSLPVRWFDSKWAAATLVLPRTSTPRACLKLVAGLDQLAVILKRADRWRREEWAIDILSVACIEKESPDLWDIEFVAETSSPPHVSLRTTLRNCPVQPLNGVTSFAACEVAVNLGAVTRALFVPLAENSKLNAAASGVSLLWIPEEALIGTINWNSVGLGLIYTTIYIPSRLH